MYSSPFYPCYPIPDARISFFLLRNTQSRGSLWSSLKTTALDSPHEKQTVKIEESHLCFSTEKVEHDIGHKPNISHDLRNRNDPRRDPNTPTVDRFQRRPARNRLDDFASPESPGFLGRGGRAESAEIPRHGQALRRRRSTPRRQRSAPRVGIARGEIRRGWRGGGRGASCRCSPSSRSG